MCLRGDVLIASRWPGADFFRALRWLLEVESVCLVEGRRSRGCRTAPLAGCASIGVVPGRHDRLDSPGRGERFEEQNILLGHQAYGTVVLESGQGVDGLRASVGRIDSELEDQRGADQGGERLPGHARQLP